MSIPADNFGFVEAMEKATKENGLQLDEKFTGTLVATGGGMPKSFTGAHQVMEHLQEQNRKAILDNVEIDPLASIAAQKLGAIIAVAGDSTYRSEADKVAEKVVKEINDTEHPPIVVDSLAMAAKDFAEEMTEVSDLPPLVGELDNPENDEMINALDQLAKLQGFESHHELVAAVQKGHHKVRLGPRQRDYRSPETVTALKSAAEEKRERRRLRNLKNASQA